MWWGPWSWARTSRQRRWTASWGCRIAWTASKASALLANFYCPRIVFHSIIFTFLLVRHSHFELKRDRSWWSFKAQWTTKIKLAAIWWKFFFVRHARCAAALSTDGHFRWDKILVCSFAALTRHSFYEMKSSKIDLELITFQSLVLCMSGFKESATICSAKQTPCPRARWLSRGMIDSVINAC